jgi:surface protein
MNDDGTKNKFSAVSGFSEINSLANWQALMTAADSTKIVISPYIYSPTQETGAPRTFGGGNDSLGGVEEIIGREPSTVSASLRNVPQSIAKVLKSLQCENVGVYLIDGNGNVEALGIVDENNNEWIMPIPIKAFFVGDKTHGGIDAPDANVIQWSFVPNYSDTLKIFTVDTFNVLSDLCGGSVPPTPPEPKKAYIPDVASVRDYVTNTTTSCVFGYKSAHSTSGYTMSGYLDDENLIEIWQDGTSVIFLSDADMYAPANCRNFFANCSALTLLDLSNFNTANVTNMQAMFSSVSSLTSLDLSNFNTANVTNMQAMFMNCTALQSLDLSNFNTANVTNMQAMFTYCSALLTLNLSNFNTANVAQMGGMFNGCSDLRTIYGGDWDKSSLTYSDDMFYGCTDIVGGNGTSYNFSHTDATYARIDRAGTPGYFTQA